jgi:hypothetical protein
MSQSLVEKFEELLTLVESLRSDVVKQVSGNKTAGIRVRRGLRDAKKMAADIVKDSLDTSK